MSSIASDPPVPDSTPEQPIETTSSPAAEHAATTPDPVDSSVLDPDTSTASISTSQDAEKHPKGRRKRTGARDKTILEEAYNNNPKPDKQARLAIVDRVSLNEREVQIWFQNRRQNDRRKSRPLTAEELAALRPGGLFLGSDPTTGHSTLPSLGAAIPSSDPACSDPVEPVSNLPSSSQIQSSPEQVRHQAEPGTPVPGSQESASRIQETPQGVPASSQDSAGSARSLPASLPSSVGYLANRWNLGSSFSAHSTPGRASVDLSGDMRRTEGMSAASKSSPQLGLAALASSENKTEDGQRHMRLSMSLEGKAELVPNTPRRLHAMRPSEMMPGPLPIPASRARGLQRSQSAAAGLELPPLAQAVSALPPPKPRLMRGRSSDVRAWESCAGFEIHDDLTDRAEAEASGSATLDIALARWPGGTSSGSSSQRRINSPNVGRSNSNKRNSPMSNTLQPLGPKKTKLNRTNSSVARLEHGVVGLEKDQDASKKKMSVSMLCSGMDSDKENLSPDEDGNVPLSRNRRPLPGAARGVPRDSQAQNARRRRREVREGDNNTPAWLSSRSKTAPVGGKAGGAEGSRGDDEEEDGDENASPAEDADVQKFMRGEVSPSKERDWNCVQSLLSLSSSRWERPR